MREARRERLRAARVLLVTDGRGDAARIADVVEAALAGGVRAVQLREPQLTARAVADLCERLRPRLDAVAGLLLVNDRADVAAAGLAHGVHLGGRSLRPAAVRAFLPPDVLVGASAHDLDELLRAAAEGADYATLSPVFATVSKPGAAALGPARAAAIAARSPIPVLWLGGIDAARLSDVAPHRPFGVAVMSAICSAKDPRLAAAELVARLGGAQAEAAPAPPPADADAP